MKILLIEDEEKICKALSEGLKQEGYFVDFITDGLKGMERLEYFSLDYDLLILDVMLPGMSGLEICQNMREKHLNLPVIMLTAKTEIDDIVSGLNLGADDYLTKPFNFEELLARVRSILRRPGKFITETVEFDNLEIDFTNKVFKKKGIEIYLTPKEYKLLEYFLKHEGEVLSREKLLAHLWSDDSNVFSNTLDVHVKNLRKKIEEPDKRYITTVRNEGYKFTRKSV